MEMIRTFTIIKPTWYNIRLATHALDMYDYVEHTYTYNPLTNTLKMKSIPEIQQTEARYINERKLRIAAKIAQSQNTQLIENGNNQSTGQNSDPIIIHDDDDTYNIDNITLEPQGYLITKYRRNELSGILHSVMCNTKNNIILPYLTIADTTLLYNYIDSKKVGDILTFTELLSCLQTSENKENRVYIWRLYITRNKWKTIHTHILSFIIDKVIDIYDLSQDTIDLLTSKKDQLSLIPYMQYDVVYVAYYMHNLDNEYNTSISDCIILASEGNALYNMSKLLDYALEVVAKEGDYTPRQHSIPEKYLYLSHSDLHNIRSKIDSDEYMYTVRFDAIDCYNNDGVIDYCDNFCSVYDDNIASCTDNMITNIISNLSTNDMKKISMVCYLI